MTQDQKALIAIDFDHTIFNTTIFVEALRERLVRDFKIDREMFMKQRQRIKDCCLVIDIDNFISALPHNDKKALHEAIIDVISNHASEFIFDDVLPFFEDHKDAFDILIITHGDKELQTNKIENSNLPDFVKHKISVDQKDNVLGEFVDKYDEIHFIDDKAANIDLVKLAHPDIVTYFIVRHEDNPYADDVPECASADYTIEDLEFTIE